MNYLIQKFNLFQSYEVTLKYEDKQLDLSYGGCVKSYNRDSYSKKTIPVHYWLNKVCVEEKITFTEPKHDTCELIKTELIKKHQVESLKSFECKPPLTNQCSKLQYFSGRNFKNIDKPVKVHRDFIPYLEKTDKLAKKCDVTVLATSSFRSTVIGCAEGATVAPHDAMHLAGFAVDFNLKNNKDGVSCDKACLKGKPEWTKCFTLGIIDIKGLFGKMRYGGDFKSTTPDFVHFDVNIKTDYLQLFISIKNSIKHCKQIQ